MSSIAMGSFDGIHIAHKKVLENACLQKGEKSICLTFREHPGKCLNGKAPAALLTADDAYKKIMQTGIDEIVYLDMNKIKDYSPECFFKKILIEKLDAKYLSCGYNYTFGKNRQGTTKTLISLCSGSGVKLNITDEIQYKGEPISSSRIRKAIENGEIEDANSMLGYAFSYTSTVVHGKHLGRQFGFPTANLYLNESLVTPRFGVYTSDVKINGNIYFGVTNIGTSPTVGGKGWRSETNILNFDEDLYGREITVTLKKFLRAEKRFADKNELIAAIRADINRAWEIKDV